VCIKIKVQRPAFDREQESLLSTRQELSMTDGHLLLTAIPANLGWPFDSLAAKHMSTEHILVTGGLGFIGGHVVQQLLRCRECHITVVDDLSGTVIAPEQVLREVTNGKPGQVDVHYGPIEHYQPGTALNTIIHLASVVGPVAVLHRAGFVADAILRATSKVICLAMEHGARLVNVSTSEVYGGGVDGYCQEDTPCVFRGRASARKEYAAGKLAAEISIQNLTAAGRLDAVTVRPFNVSGIRQSGRGGFVLPRFVGQAILNEPLTVFGDGNQVRAFTDARDIAAAMLICAEAAPSGSIYNVGNPHNRVSIDELADKVLEITGSRASKCYVDPRSIYGSTYTEAADKFPDASRIMALGWRPKFDLKATIRDLHAYLCRLPEQALRQLAGLSASELAIAEEGRL
jgi:nucleoside-diphosphate-sugar epimerase